MIARAFPRPRAHVLVLALVVAALLAFARGAQAQTAEVQHASGWSDVLSFGGLLLVICSILAIGHAIGSRNGAARERSGRSASATQALAMRLWNADGRNVVTRFSDFDPRSRKRALAAARAAQDLWGSMIPDVDATFAAAVAARPSIPSANAREEAIALRLFNLTDFCGAPAQSYSQIPCKDSIGNGLVDWPRLAREVLKIHDELVAERIDKIKADHANTLRQIAATAVAATPKTGGGVA